MKDHLLKECARCEVVLGRHWGEPYSCNGYAEKRRRPPLPVRLVSAALLDGLALANSIATKVLKRGIHG